MAACVPCDRHELVKVFDGWKCRKCGKFFREEL